MGQKENILTRINANAKDKVGGSEVGGDMMGGDISGGRKLEVAK